MTRYKFSTTNLYPYRFKNSHPVTLVKMLTPYANIIDSIDCTGGYWIYLRQGFIWDNETHMIHENTLADVKTALKRITRCHCEGCDPSPENLARISAENKASEDRREFIAKQQYLLRVLDTRYTIPTVNLGFFVLDTIHALNLYPRTANSGFMPLYDDRQDQINTLDAKIAELKAELYALIDSRNELAESLETSRKPLPMLRGYDLLKTLKRGDRVSLRGIEYTVLSVETSTDYNGRIPKQFTCYAEIKRIDGNPLLGYLYLKNLPNDPSWAFIDQLAMVGYDTPIVDPTRKPNL